MSDDRIAIDDYRVRHSGFQLHVLAAGECTAPAVMLLHGRNFHAGVWKRLGTLELLARCGYRALAVDLPGHGTSDDINISHNTLLLEVMPAFEIERPVLVAPSLAGRYAFPLIHRNPEMVSGFVGLAPVSAQEYIPRLGSSKVRSLFFWGEDDIRYPVSIGHSLAEAIPEGRLVVLPEARHACYMDQTELFHQHLTAFLEEIYGAGSSDG